MNRPVKVLFIASENVPNHFVNIDDAEYINEQRQEQMEKMGKKLSKSNMNQATFHPIVDELSESKENVLSQRPISHILPRFPYRHCNLKQKRRRQIQKKNIGTKKNLLQETENIDVNYDEIDIAVDEHEVENTQTHDSDNQKRFKNNLLHLSPNDIHNTALSIQELATNGKIKDYIMHNIIKDAQIFSQWFDLLRCGFSVLLSGVGSKKSVVKLFFKKYLKGKYLSFIIHGYLPNATLKEVLQSICDCPDIAIDMNTRKSEECMLEIIKQLENKALHIYLLINNIDGMNFRNSSVQNVFQLAAKCSYIHLLATIDHINAPLIWNQQGMLESFNWIFFDVHTWLPYIDETVNERLVTSRAQTGHLAVSAIEHVVESLTPNARRIFRIIVEAYLANSKDYDGMNFSELYDISRRSFYVNNEQSLRLQLVEFIDHHLVKLRKSSADGQEVVQLLVTELDMLKHISTKLN
ncbi:unnamed protein product [Didymodactylos carnosus]|uniref:Origin recognition complex subunit 2 n=1 Tax=Didymodactylos carnosus TaxID=1234261 RepID=A0A815BCE9_9BILA|nr:unnamed protein product [Didymodactylos carnosus]CAF4052846.1 unnamed protein product [Didymodactylos carnosus]